MTPVIPVCDKNQNHLKSTHLLTEINCFAGRNNNLWAGNDGIERPGLAASVCILPADIPVGNCYNIKQESYEKNPRRL